MWEEKCLEFIALLKERFSPEKIIMVKNFLAEKFGTPGDQKTYDNIDEIRQKNAIIGKCYTFFEANFPDIKTIDIGKRDICYSDEYFRHGCAPWHYNQDYYAEVRSLILESI